VAEKGWKWEGVQGEEMSRWLMPADEMYWLAARWKDRGYESVLDLGSGMGRHTVFFAERGFEVSALDISENGMQRTEEMLKERGLSARCVVEDMSELGFADNEFGGIVSYQVINHTDTAGVQKVVNEIWRVLKPGGEVFVTLPSKNTWGWQQNWPLLDENTKLRLQDGPDKDVPHFFADEDILRELFNNERLEIVSMRQVQYFIESLPNVDGRWVEERWHYQVLARKKPLGR